MTQLQLYQMLDAKSNTIIGYYDKRGMEFISCEDLKSDFYQILKILEEENKIVFRGFSPQSTSSNFWEYVFNVGEKGDYFRNLGNRTDKTTHYDSDHENDSQQNFEYLLSELKNNIIPNYKYGNLISDISTLRQRIDIFIKKHKMNYTQMYYFLLAWLHNIGRATGLKNTSPLISTTTSLETALSFQKKNKDSKYVYIVLLADNYLKDCFDTNQLNAILKELEIEWHENIHNEVMFKDAIVPNLIIGILEKNSSEARVILNPALFSFLKAANNFDNADKVYLLKNFALRIDQEDFDNGRKALGYDSWIEIFQDERIISNNEKKSHTVKKINDLNRFLNNN